MDFISILEQYWSLIAGLVVVIIAFANIKSQNTEQERRICNLERDYTSLTPTIIDIRTKLASIETTLMWLTKNIK